MIKFANLFAAKRNILERSKPRFHSNARGLASVECYRGGVPPGAKMAAFSLKLLLFLAVYFADKAQGRDKRSFYLFK